MKFRTLALALCSFALLAQTPKITTPKDQFGSNIGDDYFLATYAQLTDYWQKLARESNRMKLVDIGLTAEGRHQYMAVISSPANLAKLDHYKEISAKLAHAENLSADEARALAREGKAVVWIDGGLHASETVGAQQLIEWVYQMASRNDPETLRFLDDVILLNTQVNPDGQDLVANWYMRGSESPTAPLLDPAKRTLSNLPRLYAKYIGHDDNRDFFMSNMPETTNINRQLSIEWYPHILYNHHQTGPAGGVIFMPPFRDPFNYNFDALIPLGIEAVGTAMHQRLVAEGKGGSEMRSGSTYSTWWNGGLRTIAYFHNSIGLLTEIIGDPTPITIPLVPQKQLPSGDWPLPIAPQAWHLSQSIEYEITNNRAITDYASRNRETMLYNTWLMGHNSIERGSHDTWTVTPKRITALENAAKAAGPANGTGRGGNFFGAATAPTELYNTVLHDPKLRDPRGYILPSDQLDYATATEFINALLKNGVTVMRSTAAFTVNGKSYPVGSYVIKTAQAFRPHVMDMFEPQDHPNDFPFPGGPPTPPYDVTGWTLALQMGVKFDRMMEDFNGPFTRLPMAPLAPPPATVSGPATSVGYLISHEINNSFKTLNRLMKANADVYWLKKEVTAEGQTYTAGAFWVPASAAVRPILEQSAREFGVPARGIAKAPAGDALRIRPIRIGLYDQYGGLMPSGWTRWLFEQYDFPFTVVNAATLDAGDIKSKFDVLVLTDGAARLAAAGPGSRGGGGGRGGAGPVPGGRITLEQTAPQLKRFVESGGTIVSIGSSTSVGEALGLPVKNFLTEIGPNGQERALPREKFYIPGSLLKVTVDNTNPLAFGMPKVVDVFFDSSPVFKLAPTAAAEKTSAVAWFSGTAPLDSGWAWGQQYLDGGTAVAEASVGEGKVVLLGPEVNFRDQPAGTYKLLFNGLYYGNARSAALP